MALFVQESRAVSPTPIAEGVSASEIAGEGLTLSTALAIASPPAPVHVSVKPLGPVVVGVTLWLPLVAIAPLQALLPVQDVALVEDHVNIALFPTVMTFGLAAMEMNGGGGRLLS